MPEYLAPGVYVEETSFRAKSIEGVATATAGFVGQCRYGPIDGEPQLITSFEAFQRHFGGLDDLILDGVPYTNVLAHSVNLFFANGGHRVYVARIFQPSGGNPVAAHHATGTNLLGGTVRFRARFPGLTGNLAVEIDGFRSGNILTGAAGSRALQGVRPGDVVEALDAAPKNRAVATSAGPDALDPARLFSVRLDAQGVPVLSSFAGGAPFDYQNQPLQSVQKVTLRVRVVSPDGRLDQYVGLSPHPVAEQFIGKVLRHEDPANAIEPPADRTTRVFLQLDDPLPTAPNLQDQLAELLLTTLMTAPNHRQTMTDGIDGAVCPPANFQGGGRGDTATGLTALAEQEDIAIVAAPGCGAYYITDNDRTALRNHIITHCENERYRTAILCGEREADHNKILQVRYQHDSKYASLYFPWLVVRNPFNFVGQGRDTLFLPPEGAVAGIYARSDVERGVHKAPANEVVRNVLRFSRPVDKGMQDVLNPEGVNCLRFFEGRGYRVWGARTISSDPEWIYTNVRRLFIFLEHSIDRGTQWAVFEPNNERLWLKVRLTIESFLYDVWRTGALLGTTPDEAYFVRCDRSTMSQGDLDNGRLVCLIGVAPTKPAEFVIFRIGQWTADASII